MSTTLQSLPTQPVPAASRTPSVVMGKSDYLSVLLRLVAMELYKLRRRALSKVLTIIGISCIVLIFLLLGISLATKVNEPATDFAPPLCSQVPKTVDPSCTDHQPTQAELVHAKQINIAGNAKLLSLPASLTIIYYVAVIYGLLTPLIIVLAGTIIGGEYSLGTIRLLFTRGPTRIQFLLAKLLAIAVCASVGFLAITLIGVLMGYALYPISGMTPDFHFFTATWFGHTLLSLLICIPGWFTYAMIALFFGTLGRSTVAGVVAGIIWLFMELILTPLMGYIAEAIGGSTGKFLGAIPDYFISNNIKALLQNLNGSALLSNTHALFVLAGYLIACIGLSCWLTVQRDVTH